MSSYQSLKVTLVESLHLSRDAFHIFLGFAVFLAGAKLFKIPLTSFRTLVLPFAFGVVLEVKDAYDSVAYGYRYDPFDSVKDIAIALAIPVICILVMRQKRS